MRVKWSGHQDPLLNKYRIKFFEIQTNRVKIYQPPQCYLNFMSIDTVTSWGPLGCNIGMTIFFLTMWQRLICLFFVRLLQLLSAFLRDPFVNFLQRIRNMPKYKVLCRSWSSKVHAWRLIFISRCVYHRLLKIERHRCW